MTFGLRRALRAVLAGTIAACVFAPSDGSIAEAGQKARVIAFIGDSSTSAIYSPPGYPALVAKNLGVRIENLATVSKVRGFASYTVREALAEQLPRLSRDVTDAVVFLGIDDLQQLAEDSDRLSDVEAAYAKIVDELKRRRIAIHLITVRNFSRDPNYPAHANVAVQAATQRVVDTFDDWIVRLGYPTLDIRTMPDLMDDVSYSDGIHLSQLGLLRLSSRITEWFSTPEQLAAAHLSQRHQRVITFLGDVLASDAYSPPGFPALVGAALHVPIHNLAVPNGFSLNVVQDQLPNVPADTTDAVVALGTDELRSFASGSTTVADAKIRVLQIVETLKFRRINVFLIAPRDYSRDPFLANLPPKLGEWQANMKEMADRFGDWELSLGYPTIDLRAPDLSDPNNYVDGHFSPQGLERITTSIVKWFQRRDDNTTAQSLSS